MGRVRDVSCDLHSQDAGSGVRVARVSKKDAADKPKRRRASRPAAKATASGAGGEVEPVFIEEAGSVWEALGFSPQDATNLETRSALMRQIEVLIRQAGWTQAVAAKRCGVSQPRINDLLRGKINKFSIDALVNMAGALGHHVILELRAA